MASERDRTILRLYRDEGRTQAEIGTEFGITGSRVCQILVAQGYRGRERLHAAVVARTEARKREREADEQRRREDRAERDREVTRLWMAGVSTRDIGARYGVERSVVGRWAKSLGLPQRRRGGWGSSRADPNPVRAAMREITTLTKARANHCACGQEATEQCGWCAVRLCEDCARMSPNGVRCSGCVAA